MVDVLFCETLHDFLQLHEQCKPTYVLVSQPHQEHILKAAAQGALTVNFFPKTAYRRNWWFETAYSPEDALLRDWFAVGGDLARALSQEQLEYRCVESRDQSPSLEHASV
jgi:hypothetical protein